MKTSQSPGVGQGVKIVIALALSLLGLALLPVVALPYGSLDWVHYEPAYKEALSAPSALSTIVVATIPCAELPAPSEALAARVNDQAIGQQAFERELAQFLRARESMGHATESEEGQAAMPALRRQVLELLIDDVLVQQAAIEVGITVSREEIQTRVAEEVFQGGGPETFQAWLEETGQTWEEFERDVCQDLLRQAVRERTIADTGDTADRRVDADSEDALQALAFERWLATRREAAGIEIYVDTDS